MIETRLCRLRAQQGPAVSFQGVDSGMRLREARVERRKALRVREQGANEYRRTASAGGHRGSAERRAGRGPGDQWARAASQARRARASARIPARVGPPRSMKSSRAAPVQLASRDMLGDACRETGASPRALQCSDTPRLRACASAGALSVPSQPLVLTLGGPLTLPVLGKA